VLGHGVPNDEWGQSENIARIEMFARGLNPASFSSCGLRIFAGAMGPRSVGYDLGDAFSDLDVVILSTAKDAKIKK